MFSKEYWKTLWLALIGTPLLEEVNDQPVRHAHFLEILELISTVPEYIPGGKDETTAGNLIWMLHRLIEENNTFPVDKTGRWIGFIHGVLAMSGYLKVKDVRNRSRPRFHAAYIATNQIVPETLSFEL